jgi:hypothetical protein
LCTQQYFGASLPVSHCAFITDLVFPEMILGTEIS